MRSQPDATLAQHYQNQIGSVCHGRSEKSALDTVVKNHVLNSEFDKIEGKKYIYFPHS